MHHMEASWKIFLVLFLRKKPHSLIFNDYDDDDDDDDDDNGKIIFTLNVFVSDQHKSTVIIEENRRRLSVYDDHR